MQALATLFVVGPQCESRAALNQEECCSPLNRVSLRMPSRGDLIRQFDRVLMQQLAATAMPPGSLIIANVPLPPAVYQNLSGQAEAQGQTATDFMAAILTRAARQ